MHTQMKNALCVVVIGALLMYASQKITVNNNMIDFSKKLNPITRFISQKLFRIVWDSNPSGFKLYSEMPIPICRLYTMFVLVYIWNISTALPTNSMSL